MSFVRRAWPVLLGASLVPFAGWTAVRLLGVEQGSPSVQLIAFTPYVAGASVVPLVAAVASRRWRHALVAGVLVATLGGCVLPRTLAGPVGPAGPADPADPRDGATLRVLTANLLLGEASPQVVVALARDTRADVLAVQELTPAAAAALDDAGLAELLPHRVVSPAGGSGGSALYSRYPLSAGSTRQLPAGHLQTAATVHVPGAAPVPVESVHPAAPSDARGARAWTDEIRRQTPATPDGPVRVLLGDFNSTLDHDGLRRLLATGYRDAADVTGNGLVPTWPSPDGLRMFGRPVPPVTLDHVLVDARIGVRTVAVHTVPRTDHRAVSAELVLPPG